MVMLFKAICRPLATKETAGAFLYDLRLVALDGTYETIADSESNALYFGRHRNGKGEQIRHSLNFKHFCSVSVVLM